MGRRAVLAAISVALLAGVVARGGDARTHWDGCTARSGDVRFRAADGTRLVGHVFGKGPKAVVLAHQSRGDLCQWASFGKRLARRGYRAFAFDFRNYGQSQARRSPSILLSWDVAAAARFLRARGARKVFLIGA